MSVRALTCPACGGAIELRAAGSSVSLACGHCGAVLDATRPELAQIAKAQVAMAVPAIALGTRGVLDDIEWEAIGYVERSAPDGSWSEYLLFNPYEGYRFLVDNGARFSLGALIDREPRDAMGGVVLDGELYHRAGLRYEARVTFVVGEFYCRVKVGETVGVREYARAGIMLAYEGDGAGETWTKLRLLDRGEGEDAFGIPRRPRSMFGATLPHEGSPWLDQLWTAVTIAVLATGALLAIVFLAPPEVRLLQAASVVTLGGADTTEVVGTIDVARATRVSIAAEATLDNDWVDQRPVEVDRRTQASLDGYGLIERYYGQDSDGPWSEGAMRTVTSFSAVPPGRYDVVASLGGHRWAPPAYQDTRPDDNVGVGIEVDGGGMFAGPAWLAFLLIAAWPAWLGLMEWNYRQGRTALGLDA